MKSFTTLIVSGGAVRGFALLGALQYLMDNNMMSMCNTFVGTSIGAIISYLICIGYSPVELMVILCQTHWFQRMTNFDVYNVIQGSGALSFSIVQEILEKLTVKKIGKFITLGELYQQHGKKLVCCTYNYTLHREEFLDYTNHPLLPCLTALRMSANIPLLFEPFEYNGYLYFDGGLSTNFPVQYIQTTNEEQILGVFLRNNKPSTQHPHHFPTSFELMWNILTIPMNHLQEIRLLDYKNIIELVEIDASEYFPLQFDISNSEKFDMFSIGYTTLKQYFEKNTALDDEIE